MLGRTGCEAPATVFSMCLLSPGVEVNKPTHFTVYTKGAGKARPEVRFSGAAKGAAVRDFEIIDNHNYSYTVRYTAVQQVRVAHAWPPSELMLTAERMLTAELMLTPVSVTARGTCPSQSVTEETPSQKAPFTSALPPCWT